MEGIRETAAPVGDLRAAGFDDAVEAVASAVDDYRSSGAGGTVALVSEPYAGRSVLLDHAAARLDAPVDRLRLSPPAADGDAPTVPDDGVVFVADCHALFERRIDGFETLDAFLDRLALSDALVVTTWNRYAWSYLDAVRDVSDPFTRVVSIPRLDADEIRTVVTHHYDDLPDIVDAGRAGRVRSVVFDSRPVSVPGGTTISVPYPKPNPAWITSDPAGGDDIAGVVFEKLRRAANGNPGVALAVWESSVRDNEIAPGYIESPSLPSIDDTEAFLLWTVVTTESVGLEALDDRHEEARAALQSLADAGLVAVSDGTVSVAPETLPLAVEALERRRLLW